MWCVILYINCIAGLTLSINDPIAISDQLPGDLGKIIARFTNGRPTAIIMDNRKLGSFERYWGKIKVSRERGNTFFLYKTYLEDQPKSESRVKPYPWRSNYRYNITFGWTFVCFLEVVHSMESLNVYLHKLLSVGNGRTDHFVFVGGRFLLRPLLKNPLLKKFRNAVGIETNGPSLLTHYRNSCRNTGQVKPFLITNELSLPVPTWVPRQENCLSGHHFRMVGTDFPPYMYYIRPEHSKHRKWEYEGINYLILTNGAEKYNYTFSLNHPSEWQLMGEQDNGTWNGIFGDLVYGRAEIASVSNPTADRNGLVDFIGPFGKSNLVFMSANPLTYADAGEYAIFHPLPLYVWLFIAGGFLLVWILNSIALEIRYSRGQDRYEDSLKRAFLMMMAFTFEQEVKKPKGLPMRLLMVVWVAFMIIIATSYRYNLASYIVTPQPSKVPKTFHELYDQEEYKIIFDLGGVSGWNHFRTNGDPKIQALVRRATKTEDTSWCTVRAFQEISTVCAGWDFSLAYASAKNLTITLDREALYSSEPFFEAWFVFATENNSVFTNEFMKIGRAFFEVGLVQMWEEKIVLNAKYIGRQWLLEREDSDLYTQLLAFRTRTSRSILEKLDWKNVQFIFLIFSVGIFISTIVFIGEVIQGNANVVKRFFNRKKIKIRKISRIVRRKISGEITPPSTLDKDERKGKQSTTITVAFLP